MVADQDAIKAETLRDLPREVRQKLYREILGRPQMWLGWAIFALSSSGGGLLASTLLGHSSMLWGPLGAAAGSMVGWTIFCRIRDREMLKRLVVLRQRAALSPRFCRRCGLEFTQVVLKCSRCESPVRSGVVDIASETSPQA